MDEGKGFCPVCGAEVRWIATSHLWPSRRAAREVLPSQSGTCPGCGRVVIGRDGYAITRYALTSAGECEACKMPISGRFGPFSESFGNRRIASALGRDV